MKPYKLKCAEILGECSNAVNRLIYLSLSFFFLHAVAIASYCKKMLNVSGIIYIHCVGFF